MNAEQMITDCPTVVHDLMSAATEVPDTEALVYGEVRLTYREYFDRVTEFAAELRERGVSGHRVATVLGNSADTCIAYFAIHLAGAQLVPLNPLYTVREISEILSDAEPALIIADCEVGEMVAEAADASLCSEVIFLGAGFRNLTSQALLHPGGLDAVALPDPDSLALLQYTGGTTGRPKGVQLTHKAIATNVNQREAILPTCQFGERVLAVMPLFHSYALSMALYLTANSRGCLVVLPRYRPDLVLDAIQNERITLFPGNPTIFSSLLAHESAHSTDWTSVRMCFSGSAALSLETLSRWESLAGAPVYEGYGQTEAGPILTFNPFSGGRKPGSVGVALPHTTVEVVEIDDPTDALPPGTLGEIRACGPQLMSGYLNRAEETREALHDGWLYTGDIGEFDDDGYLFIRDRKKELVIVSGYNVYPREVEEVLFAHPAVMDAAVIGAPDGYRGETLCAYVVANLGGTAVEGLLEDLSCHCRRNLAKYKVPSQIVIVESLPKTPVNKTDKRALRELEVMDRSPERPVPPTA